MSFTQAEMDAIYQRRGTPEGVRPFVNAIFGQESGGGRADTRNAGIDGARGPMQVIEPTFNDLRRRGLIPSDYQWSNPQHSAEAGIAYAEDMMRRFNNNPAQAAAAYFGGPGAIDKNGAILTGRADSNGKTIGSYVNDVVQRMKRSMNPSQGDTTAVRGSVPQSPRVASNPSSYTYEYDESFGNSYTPVENASTTGAVTRGVIGGAIPAVGGFGTAVAGAALGTAIAPGVGTLIGGLVGGFGGGAALAYGQEKLFEEFPELAKALGQDNRQRMIDQYQHPTASFVGGLLPNFALLRPSTMPFRSVGSALGRAEAAAAAGADDLARQQEALAAGIRMARVNAGVGAGLMGGMELGQQMYNGEPVDLTRVGLAAAVGALGNKETALGRGIADPIRNFGTRRSTSDFQGGARTMSDEAYAPDQTQTSATVDAGTPKQGELFPFRPGLEASEQYAPVPSNIPANLPESAWPKWYADQVAAQRARAAQQGRAPEQLEIPGFERPNQNQLDLFDNPASAPESPATQPGGGYGDGQMDLFPMDNQRTPRALAWDGAIKLGSDQPIVDPNAPPNFDQQRAGVRGQPLLTYEPTANSERGMSGLGGNTLLPPLPPGADGQMRMRLPTPRQPDIPTNRGNTTAEAASETPATDSVAPTQMDMFAETPTSTVITDFGIAQIVRNMRSVISKGLSAPVKVTSKLLQSARELSRVLGTHDSNQIEAYLGKLAAEEKALETRPLKSDTISERLAVINAKRYVIDLYMDRMADATGQETGTRVSRALEEGQRRAKPGTAFDNTQDDTGATEQQMRQRNAEQAAEERKAANVQSSARRTAAIAEDVSRMEAARRDRILQDVIADSTPDNVEANFFAALKRSGIRTRSADIESLLPAEREKIDRFRGTYEAFEGDSGRQEELFSNQEAPVRQAPEGTPRSALRGEEPAVEQDDGPDYLNRELFSVPTDGSRAVPTRQAMGTTLEQRGISRRQLVAKADELLAQLRGGKSRDLLQRAVNQFMQNRADYSLVENTYRLVKERKFAEAERNVVSVEPKKRAPRAETPKAAPVETPKPAEPPLPPKGQAAVDQSKGAPAATKPAEKPLPARAQAAVDQSKGTPAETKPTGVAAADLETQKMIREKAVREVTRAETERYITTELANNLRKMLYAKDFADKVDGVYSTLKAKRAEYERKLAGKGAQKKSPNVDETEAANARLKEEVRQAYRAERDAEAAPDGFGRGENPFDRMLRRGEEGDAPEGRMSVDDVNGVIENVTRNWKRKPNIKVVQRIEDLPARLRDMPSDSKGVFDTDGSLYIVADQATSAGDVRATIFHETLGHYGLQGKFGKALGNILKNAYESNAKLRQRAERWIEKQLASDEGRRFYGDLPPNQLRRIAVEEVLANTSEGGPIRLGLMDRIVATIRDFGRRLGLNVDYSDYDVYHILSRAHDYAMGREFGGVGERRLNAKASSGIERSIDDGDLPDTVKQRFEELGDMQRGDPEMAMLKYQHAHSGVMNWMTEHIGDLTHRMTNMIKWGRQYGYGIENVSEKVEKALRMLTRQYGFLREHNENIASNANYRKVDKAEYQAMHDKALENYVAEHKKLPVYNRAQWLGREAAVAIGELRFDDAVKYLRELQDMTSTFERWEKEATTYRLDKSGEPIQYNSSGERRLQSPDANEVSQRTRIYKDESGAYIPTEKGQDSDMSPASAGFKTIEADDNIALDSPEIVGATQISSIDAKVPGSGAGSELLKGITAWADKNGKTLVVVPARSSLKSWYERNGFEDRADYMVRKPASKDGFSTPEEAATAATTRLRRDMSDEAFDFIQERMPEPARRPLQQVVSSLLYTTKRGVTAWAFTPEIAENAYKAGVKSARKYVRAMTEREKLKKDKQIEVENILTRFDNLPDKLKGNGEGTVNKLLYRSTVSGKWAFKPDYFKDMPDGLIDADLQRQFNAMPKEAQAIIQDVFKYGHDTLRQMKSGVLETVASEYRQRLESLAPELLETYDTAYQKYSAAGEDDAILSAMTDVRKAAKTDELKEAINIIQSSIRADTAKYYKLMGMNEFKPYAPIRRFGKYVVVGRSPEYMQMQKQLGGETKQADLDKMKADPDHYFVDFAATFGEAQGMARDLEARFGKGNTTYFEKDNADAALGGGRDMYLAFQRLQRLMTEHFGEVGDKRGLDEARKLISDLYISTLIDTSSRKSELRRLNVAGNDMDMMRAFASKGLADAHFVGNLFKNGEVLDTMNSMRNEVRNGGNASRADRQLYVNELLTRHAMTMGTPDMTWANVINRATSMWMLSMSPSYYVQNMTQPFMMSLPYMAGRHGYAESTNLFMQAYQDLAPMLKSAKATEPLDLTKNVPKDVEPVLKELILRGLIDIGIDTDLGTWASQGNGKLTKHWNAVDRGLRNLVQKTETMNRLSTGIAAYRAEFLKLATENPKLSAEARQNAAMEYAADVIRTTHGNYDAFSAPRYFNTPTGKVLLQFKKFQLIQLGMMAKLAKNSFGTGEEALIARKALGFTMGHAAALGGALGLPGMAAIGWLYSKFAGDENDPANLEEDLRAAIGDPEMAQVLLKGTPNVIGLDMSSRIGMGNLLSVVPYTDVEGMDRDTYKNVVVALLGPAIGGLGPRAADAFGQMAGGDYYKGLETLMPTGLPQGIAKSYRISTDGVTQKNSDMLIRPEDVGDVTKFYSAIGMPSTQLSNQQWARHRQMQVEQFFKDRTSEVKRDYLRALKDGDAEGVSQVKEAWLALQTSRVKYGLKPQSMAELAQAARQQATRERRTVGGLAYSPATQGYATQLAEMTGAEGY